MTDPLLDYDMVIGGQPRAARSGRTYESLDPYRGTAWARVPDAGAGDVDDAVAAARDALEGPWAQLTATRRGELLQAIADLVLRDADALAELETRDNGKLLREMRGQMTVLAQWYRYFGGLADKVEGSVIPTDKANFLVYTRNEPVGVVAAIVPWNSPLLLLAWKLAPALAAGCTVVVKPSDHAPVSVLAFARLFAEAGFPPGVVNVVTGWGPETGAALAQHPGVDKIAFTGSTSVGRLIAHAAADNLTPVLLELGGKSAQVVFDDADLDAAANGIIGGIFAATGQTCMAGSRVLAHRDIHDELVRRVAQRSAAIVLGDPLDPATEMGPVSNRRQFDTVRGYLDLAAEDGATAVLGGADRVPGDGLFIPPTILTDTRPGMRVVDEEIFGPVAAFQAFADEDEAIALANGTRFGLAAAVWTGDVRRAHRVAARLRAGTVWVNAYRVVAPQVPFGGMGDSGIGRENGQQAIREYLDTKAVWVELSGATRDPFVLG